ncbi:MAG: hypothetical protein AAB250_01800, partial [Bdellovibrionota bacterium]
FEKVGNQFIFRHRILTSVESKLFFFEDPRISVVYENGQPHYFLSGTDYSPHVEGSTAPDVMNRFVELKIDGDGLPMKVEVDATTGKPDFMDLSPAPRMVDGQMLYVDAKNATIAKNDAGQIVVRTRLRPDFKHPYVQRLAEGDRWDYAEQVFVFTDWAHFRSYDWNDVLVDLFGKRGVVTTTSQPPLIAKIIIRDTEMKEHLQSNDPKVKIATNKPKGMGPGTRPLRFDREGDVLYGSDGPGAPRRPLGRIPKTLLQNFPIADGKVIYMTFDHEIRYFYQKAMEADLRRRHYSGSNKVFDSTLWKMTDYLPDVVQPKTEHER